VSTTKRSAPRTPSVARQAAPSPDRYKEIQQALAAKGYLKSEPSGVWDADSVAAMRQFQTDRKLDPSGKLTAASLIDLGLGPHSETPPKVETPPPPQP
jgi:peptidoglycan hydrolase-like protein with peptidoglycan-binding domain